MDNYLDKNRFISLYHIQAKGKADELRNTARDAAMRHIRSVLLRDKFRNEIEQFIQEQLKSINRARNEQECKYILNNLYQEKSFIDEQNHALNVKRAKVIVSAELTTKLDTWGYFINGVGVILGTGQVLVGGGIVSASIFTGNIVGVIAGASLVLHGLNNIQESALNIINNRDNTSGFIRDGYSATANFLGFEAKAGSIAFSSMDLMLSGYGLGRMVLKPDTWRLFRFIPADYIRNIKVMGAPALAIEALGDGLTIKSIYENHNDARR